MGIEFARSTKVVTRQISQTFKQCEVCEKFNVKIIACITEASVINKILSYLDKQNLPEADNDSLMPPLRAPPDVTPCSDYIIQHDFGFAGSVTDA